jgi:WD40 repeat protein
MKLLLLPSRRTTALFLPDGKRIISSGLDDTVRIWDISSGREQWRGEFGLFGVTALAVSKDGATAAWAGHQRKIVVWDMVRGRRKFEINTSGTVVCHLSFTSDGMTLAAAENDERVHMYDALTGFEREGIALDDTDVIEGTGI